MITWKNLGLQCCPIIQAKQLTCIPLPVVCGDLEEANFTKNTLNGLTLMFGLRKYGLYVGEMEWNLKIPYLLWNNF